MSLLSINPFSLETLRKYPECPTDELLRIISDVKNAQKSWASTDISNRVTYVLRLAENLRVNSNYHAKTISNEMGKPITEALAEIEKCAFLCDHYASNAETYLEPRAIESNYSRSFVKYEPLGIFAAIMPWNFPYWQVFRAIIPNILAGNASVLKHASNVTTCALNIESIFQASGFPMNLVRTATISGKNAALLIAHPDIAGVSFTGSNPVGEKIGGLAGTQIKKTILELGGSDPSIILEDAELTNAAQKTVLGRMLNAGQSCIAAKRIFVHKNRFNEYIDLVKSQLESIQLGDPLDPSTQMGPLATKSIHNEIDQQVKSSMFRGAECWIPTSMKNRPLVGYQYPPTLMMHLTPDMPVCCEETFGPVLCVSSFHSETEAIEKANHTQWGLGCSIYTQDIEKGINLGGKIEAGTCTINDFVKSDPRIPFGGIKKSGFGRELSIEGIHEFTNVKTYNIQS